MNSDYPVFILSSEKEIEQCPVFTVDEFRWNCVYHPETTGQLGYIPGKGFFLKMSCMESNPMRNQFGPNSMVYKDSAMEGFFCFSRETSSHNYMNFEMNANGSLLIQRGEGRFHRTFLSKEEVLSCNCQAEIFSDHWTVSTWIPETLIRHYYDINSFSEGFTFRCNFFKISETPEIEHYASAYPINSTEPNFHLPEFFGTAIIVPNTNTSRNYKPSEIQNN